MKVCFVFVICVASGFAQLPDSVWSRAYGVDNAHWKCVGLVRTDDGGFVLAGNQERGEWEADYRLLIVSAGGDSLDTFSADWEDLDICHSIARTADNQILLAGTSGPPLPPTRHARLVKLPANMSNMWQHIYPYSDSRIGYCAIETPWHQYLFAGVNADNGDTTTFVFRLAPDGEELQSVSISGNDIFAVRSIAANADSTYAIAGHTTWTSNGLDDFWFRKYTLQGPAGIGGVYGGPARDRCEKIIATSDGGYLLAGTTLSFGAGDQDILLIKINEFGDSLWSQTFGGVYFDDFGSVVETSFGSYLVVGTHENESDDNFDLLLGSCDANGGHRQQSFIGGAAEDVGMDLLPLDSGVVMIAGHTRSLGGDWRKLWLLRTEYRPHLSVDRGSITFGAVQLGDSLTRVLNIYNAGGVELSLDSLTFPRGYHVNLPLPLLLNPGQELPLEIIFAPQQVGAHVGNMTIYSDAQEGPLQVRLVGSGQGSAVRRGDELLPARTELTSIFPNPFNAETELQFTLSAPQHATLTIYDTQGRTVSVLLDEPLSAGLYTVHFSGRERSSGLYIVTLNTPSAHDSRKLILLR